MTLPLFPPDGATGADRARDARRVTLVRLASEIARTMGSIGRLVVEGEVYRPTTSRGGWVFFTLRDRAAQIDVKVPRAQVRRCRVVAGERACVVGALEWSPDRGQVQLVAEEITPVGAGAVAALIADVRRRLAAEGFLDRARRPLPLLPATIGVVCGADAAVRKDIESVVATRFAGYPIHFEETTVSGPGASTTICEALRRVVARGDVDVVILARGGGDATSLLPWSSEEVCRAVASCRVPVVAAIGHEADRPLVDEIADHRSATPSIAAALVVPDRAGLQAGLDGCVVRAARVLVGQIERSGRRLDGIDPGRALEAGVGRAQARIEQSRFRIDACHPARRLDEERRRLQSLDWRRPVWEHLARANGRAEAEGRHLRALGPRRVLERGYAIVTAPDGSVLRRALAVPPGAMLAVTLAEGRLTARVEEVHGE